VLPDRRWAGHLEGKDSRVCEVWRWIIIVTVVPVLLFRLSDFPFVLFRGAKWQFGGARWQMWFDWVNRHMRQWWFAVGVLIFATIIYGVHCR
jgi:hypothetical protein